MQIKYFITKNWGIYFAGTSSDNDVAAQVLSGSIEVASSEALRVLARQLKNRLYLFTKAFDLGIIEYQRVLDVTILPFIKLAQKCQHPTAGFLQLHDNAPDTLFSFWAHALEEALSWHSKSSKGSGGELKKPAMQAFKRAEMVKALLAARIHEVRQSSTWLWRMACEGFLRIVLPRIKGKG